MEIRKRGLDETHVPIGALVKSNSGSVGVILVLKISEILQTIPISVSYLYAVGT